MVEQWSPKPQVKGSNPFSPDYTSSYNLVKGEAIIEND
jgi:hypothetical protein